MRFMTATAVTRSRAWLPTVHRRQTKGKLDKLDIGTTWICCTSLKLGCVIVPRYCLRNHTFWVFVTRSHRAWSERVDGNYKLRP